MQNLAITPDLHISKDPALNPDQDCIWIAGLSESEFNGLLAEADITATSKIDNTDTGWKLFGGFQFNPNFALEVGYVNLGEIKYDFNFTAPVTGTGNGSIEVDGFAFSGLAIIPIGDRFGLFGRAGIYAWNASADVNITETGYDTYSASDDNDDTDFFYGFGAKYDINSELAARVEWERYDIDGDNIDLISGSLVLSF